MKAGLSKKERAYQGIRRAIISGRLQPGQFVNEAELAEEYAVSKTPVREALCVLAHEGLVTPVPRAGYMVSPVTVRDIQETFQLRLILEGEAIRLATPQISEEAIESLEQLLHPVTLPDAHSANREFHTIIAMAAGNQRLATLIGQLLDDMQRMLALDPLFKEAHYHQDIVEALKKRDAHLAREAMCDHIEQVRFRILQRI